MSSDQLARADSLRRKLQPYQGFQLRDAEPVSTGAAALDKLLPLGGLRSGSLVEYLAAGVAGGAGSLSLAAARGACAGGRAFVALDRERRFYPPAAAGWGIDLSQLLLIRPATKADELWALDQALRCPGVGAVWMRGGAISSRDFRRLQLAAEAGGTLGILIRPARLRGRPTWAEVQWLVEPRPSATGWRLNVELLRCPGGAAGRSGQVEWSEQTGDWREVSDYHATHFVHSPAELADATAARRQSRA